jgi:hypothetical protein
MKPSGCSWAYIGRLRFTLISLPGDDTPCKDILTRFHWLEIYDQKCAGFWRVINRHYLQTRWMYASPCRREREGPVDRPGGLCCLGSWNWRGPRDVGEYQGRPEITHQISLLSRQDREDHTVSSAVFGIEQDKLPWDELIKINSLFRRGWRSYQFYRGLSLDQGKLHEEMQCLFLLTRKSPAIWSKWRK